MCKCANLWTLIAVNDCATRDGRDGHERTTDWNLKVLVKFHHIWIRQHEYCMIESVGCSAVEVALLCWYYCIPVDSCVVDCTNWYIVYCRAHIVDETVSTGGRYVLYCTVPYVQSWFASFFTTKTATDIFILYKYKVIDLKYIREETPLWLGNKFKK